MSHHYIQTKVTGIDVYLRGAVVYRQGMIQLDAGENTFYLSGLPSKVDTSSIHMKFSGQVSHCRILNSGSEHVNKDDLPEMKEIKNINRKLSIEERQIDALKAAEVAWTKNSDFTGRPNITFDESVNYIQQLPERMSQLSEKILKHEEEIEKLKSEKQHLEEKIEKVLSNLKNSVRIDVQVRAAGEYEFEFSYTDPQVYWMPFYEIWMVGSRYSLQVHMRARVWQTTGEDWDNVAMTLFYGDMNQSGDCPELKPWYVSYNRRSAILYEPEKYSVFCPKCGAKMDKDLRFCPNCGAPVSRNKEVFLQAAAAPVLMTAPEIKESIVSEDVFSKYELYGHYSIASGRYGIIVDVLDFQIPATYQYCSVPKKAPGAYLTAHIDDAARYHFLPCEGELFVENTHIGTIEIAKEPAKDMVLSLGKERRVEVERNVIKDIHSTQKIKNGQIQSMEYEILVKNTMDEMVNLLIKDQIPVSKDREITVAVHELSSGNVDWESGEVTWNLFLNPRQAQTLRLAFSVSYPKGKTIYFNH